MKPFSKYLEIVQQSEFIADQPQQEALALFNRLQDDLLLSISAEPTNWWKRVFSIEDSPHPYKGIYLWGGVGRGKTFLMDIFYQCLPIEQKCRIHFHQFMNDVHQSLRQMQDMENPKSHHLLL
jgi:cell division protein ZapE